MKNKKIVDYIVVKENNKQEDLSKRLEEAKENQITKLAKLKDEQKALNINEIQYQIYTSKMIIKGRNESAKQGRKISYLPFDFNNTLTELSVEEIETKIKELSIDENKLKELEKPILEKIKKVEKELSIANDFKNNTLAKIKRNLFEENIVKLMEQGYVPQGGVCVKHYHLYQAMVKYEE